MKRWLGLVIVTGTLLTLMPAPQASAAPAGVARSFQLEDLGGLADILGLGGGGLGSLGDLLGLGGDALGGLLGDILGGLGGSRRSDDRYEDSDYGYDYGFDRRQLRRSDRSRVMNGLFGRLDRGANGFVERAEVNRFARRSGRATGRSQAQFNRLDRNRDGRLSRSEFGRLFR